MRMAGMARGGLMTGAISECHPDGRLSDSERAQRNFARLVAYVAELYCMGGSSSIDVYEAQELAASVAYVLGIADATVDEARCVLDVDDPMRAWRSGLAALDVRVEDALALRREIVSAMPPIYNVSLRDTLASLGELRIRYDTYFAAHEIPCSIDYQLSEPIDSRLRGIDYIEAWLAQLLEETRWIARFTVGSCVAVLGATCPDYRGLHVNLYDLLRPHEDKLEPVTEAKVTGGFSFFPGNPTIPMDGNPTFLPRGLCTDSQIRRSEA